MSSAEFPTPPDRAASFGSSQKPSKRVAAVPTDSAARVRALNDAFRRSFAGGRVVETPGVVVRPARRDTNWTPLEADRAECLENLARPTGIEPVFSP